MSTQTLSKVKAPKFTTVEKRAYRMCLRLVENAGGRVEVKWKRSAMYGYNPVIETHEGKCTSVSGCGYDKLSTTLADTLRFLFPVNSDSYNAVGRTGGAGESATIRALEKHDWKLEPVYSGDAVNVYELSKIA